MKFTSIFLFLLLICSCEKSYFSNYNPKNAKDVFQEKCVSCHSYLEKSDQYLVQMEYVKAGVPEKSILYRFLKNSHTNGPENMPPKDSLSKKEIEMIKSWILNLNLSTQSSSKILVNANNPLTELELFNRCSLQLTNYTGIESNPKIYENLKLKNITSTQACLQILENSHLSIKGMLKNKNTFSKQTLLTFQKVHNNWFNEWNFFVAMSTWGTFEILDPGSMGYFFTKSLLDKEFTFRDIFKGKRSFEGIRESKVEPEFLLYKFKNEKRYKIKDYRFVYGLSENGKEYKTWNPKRVPTGELIGVKAIPVKRDVVKILVNSKDNQKEIKPAVEQIVNKDIHLGLGGGVLGSEVYINLNLGQELGRSMDGGRIQPRIWAKSVIKEFLCRDLPVVPITKSEIFVNLNSNLPFRKNKSCMSCHITMDPMSYLVRNVEQSLSADAGGDGMIHSTHLKFYQSNTSLKNADKFPDKDELFHLRPAHGKFIYQDIRGNFINKNIKTLDDLGSALLETDDVYLCTAKKYLNFLTGINVNMNLFIDKNLTKQELYIRNLLEEAGRVLKKNGDLTDVIGVILNSEIYRGKDFSVNIQ
ncbi:MAG: hypothetical protein HN576_16510 [Bacteriovoracaceae bacterium]|nr:hypothetical protein [Bacteriovoracaceae bacterium]